MSRISSRSSCFTRQEVDLLKKLVSKHRSVILNKDKKDFQNSYKRENTWKIIADEFNADKCSVQRSHTQLKNKFLNLKKSIKKKDSSNCKSCSPGSCAKAQCLRGLTTGGRLAAGGDNDDNGRLPGYKEDNDTSRSDNHVQTEYLDLLGEDGANVASCTRSCPGKDRTSKFSHNELDRYKKLVFKHRSAVMNVKTDVESSVMKDDAWRMIAEEFNADKRNIRRSHVQLKSKFTNIKKAVRMEEKLSLTRSSSEPRSLSAMAQWFYNLMDIEGPAVEEKGDSYVPKREDSDSSHHVEPEYLDMLVGDKLEGVSSLRERPSPITTDQAAPELRKSPNPLQESDSSDCVEIEYLDMLVEEVDVASSTDEPASPVPADRAAPSANLSKSIKLLCVKEERVSEERRRAEERHQLQQQQQRELHAVALQHAGLELQILGARLASAELERELLQIKVAKEKGPS